MTNTHRDETSTDSKLQIILAMLEESPNDFYSSLCEANTIRMDMKKREKDEIIWVITGHITFTSSIGTTTKFISLKVWSSKHGINIDPHLFSQILGVNRKTKDELYTFALKLTEEQDENENNFYRTDEGVKIKNLSNGTCANEEHVYMCIRLYEMGHENDGYRIFNIDGVETAFKYDIKSPTKNISVIPTDMPQGTW